MDDPTEPSAFFLALAIALGRGCGGALGGLAAFATLAADVGHVCTVAAHGLAAFLSGPARFFGIEFVRRAFLVGGLAALAGYFTLLVLVHRGEAALGGLSAFLRVAWAPRAFAAFSASRHVDLLVPLWVNVVAASA
jgi:hypothetical protein